VPDPEAHPEVETQDFCLPCYVRAGFADLWEVKYVSSHGDTGVVRFDALPGTHPFEIPNFVRDVVPMWERCTGYLKVEVLDEADLLP